MDAPLAPEPGATRQPAAAMQSRIRVEHDWSDVEPIATAELDVFERHFASLLDQILSQ